MLLLSQYINVGGTRSMSMKVMWGGALLFCGWMWFYLFVRQLLFNFMTAYPLIKSMRKTQEELIAIGAKRYTTVSVVVCTVICAIVAGAIIAFCPLYMIICFFAGAAVALVTYLPKLTPKNRAMFDIFCSTYYRFVPDDELRTAMYNKKPSQMKLRLHIMELSTDFIPKFVD